MIPAKAASIRLGLGEWLNSETISATRHGHTFTKGKNIVGVGQLRARRIERVHLLGSNEPLEWSQRENGPHTKTPSQRLHDHTYIFKIILKIGG